MRMHAQQILPARCWFSGHVSSR